MNPMLEEQLREELNRLPPGQQQRVLEFARSLPAKEARGVPGKALIRFGGVIQRDDLLVIEAAIEAGCEHVNPHEW
jgi:hypothetical protein